MPLPRKCWIDATNVKNGNIKKKVSVGASVEQLGRIQVTCLAASSYNPNSALQGVCFLTNFAIPDDGYLIAVTNCYHQPFMERSA